MNPSDLCDISQSTMVFNKKNNFNEKNNIKERLRSFKQRQCDFCSCFSATIESMSGSIFEIAQRKSDSRFNIVFRYPLEILKFPTSG